MHRITIPLVALFLGGCTAQAQQEAEYPPESRCEGRSATGACSIYGVSLVELIANPRTFDGLRVRVTGYLHLEFEGNGIYLHQDDHTHGLYRNGLWVDFARNPPRPPACNRSYALIEGVFDAGDTGHMGLWSGAIHDVGRCMAWGVQSAPQPAPAPP